MSTFNEIHALQFAWFTPEEAATKEIEATFRNTFGLMPDQVQRQRPPASPVPITVASATEGTTQFRVQAVPGRVDLFIEPTSNDPTHFPAFTDFAVILEGLTRAKTFCQFTGSGTYRQSFIVKLAKRVPDPAGFGDEFARILGVNNNLRGAADLSFQLNKTVHLGQYDINRVLRWTAETAQYQQFSFNAAAPLTPGPIGLAYFVTYLIDINTVPNLGKSFDAGGQIAVLEKLGSVVQRCVGFESLGDVK
ncbi:MULTISPECIES: hypothetical protein [unclassified Mesorhizobium]|uniref:hypothetical protein n=1 Tax=unclassified Mesorhizobium TaxID=325217 RepID=UPI000FCAA00F|nr:MULTISPECIES: hypothetical protein [unclassified Mesorhizobium]RUV02375.1 hypothetical protein EOA79_17635 [Mesorhizobium sp. M1A.F.Ca.IN.020.03.2.1]RUV88905.1 hypothetical protein EOA51_06185 [Mesorhizobium sp. M1A.F.Ca.IN.020.32.1.1]RUV94586.1 hypothetical protein EOA49_28795 [Mesorhizobium sp. M1A.F.Ca.IN.020.04.1.1]RUW05037.1 hypothetical protein EOA53_26860 [Mesorhizobium sp. M1A.F.Ca.IN.020.03.1.1]RUW06008.1 hypothetical protein EOA46_27095 [Mesorhizobium sp. M1A.F.Ca.IN.022.05.2.1]